ncbi:MAG: FG-GAP repeat domain-containing protein, partial [Chloroflexota bacterium]
KRVEGLRIYINEDGKLRERSKALSIEPRRDIAVLVEDLTGDGRLDIAQLNRSKLSISKGTAKGFKLIYQAAVPFAVDMAAGDVNGDGALDIYVVAGNSRGNEQDYLLLNEGRGRKFQSVRIPQARDGSGSDVMALDYDQNGLTDFVVLNGNAGFQGTTQLLASFSSTTDD